MARIHQPTTGRVRTRGRVSALLELGAGFHPELSGRENVYLNGAILGLRRREIDAVFDEVVAFAGLERFIDSPVKVYSSGMYVRLGFAVAVHVEPDILMIDEVIAVGDEEFQRRCLDHLYQLRRDGVSIVLVSHSMGTMQSLCDRLAWLDHGELQKIGTPVEVVRAYLGKVDDARGAAARGRRRGRRPDARAAARHPGDRDHPLRGARCRQAPGAHARVGRLGGAARPLRGARARRQPQVRHRAPGRERLRRLRSDVP